MADRSFLLINSLGQTYNLNDEDSFLHDIEGLGFERNTKYIQIGNMFVETKDLSKQKAIKGTIKFISYEKYKEFSLFIQKKPLTLIYTSSSEVRISVNVEKLTKAEFGVGGLYSDIVFVNLGLYYKIISAENEISVGIGKVYPYTYPYTYTDNTSGAVTIDSESVEKSPVKLTILGPFTNVSWTHNLNSDIKTTGKVNCSIPSGNKLVVDTSCSPWAIKEYNSLGEFVKNQHQESDWSTTRFIMLEYGLNKISFTHEGTETLKVIAEGMISYDSI